MIRVALECDVDVNRLNLDYDNTWKDQDVFWTFLKDSRAFKGQRLPPKSDRRAWLLGLEQNLEMNGEAVVLTVTMHPTQSNVGPYMRLELHPLKREQSSRLFRQFGSTRFVEVRVPTVESWPSGVDKTEALAARWLTRSSHQFMERTWAGFYVLERSIKVEMAGGQHGSGSKSVFYDRVMLFAEQGKGLGEPYLAKSLGPSNMDGHSPRGACSRYAMVNWLLNLKANGAQPYLKLFHRISLGKLSNG